MATCVWGVSSHLSLHLRLHLKTASTSPAASVAKMSEEIAWEHDRRFVTLLVIRHEVYDGKADVWSWGVLFVEMLTCQMPYSHTYLTPVQVGLAESQLRCVCPGSAGCTAACTACDRFGLVSWSVAIAT